MNKIKFLRYFVLLVPVNCFATAIYVNDVPKKIYKNDGGWVYKYRAQVTNSSDSTGKSSVPHFISVRGMGGVEIPFASADREFLVKGTSAKIVDIYIKESDIDKKTMICAMRDGGGLNIGSCSYLHGRKSK